MWIFHPSGKLPSGVLHRVWNLADVDRDGKLDIYEFALAMHFVRMRLDGHTLPHVITLTDNLA